MKQMNKRESIYMGVSLVTPLIGTFHFNFCLHALSWLMSVSDLSAIFIQISQGPDPRRQRWGWWDLLKLHVPLPQHEGT